MPTYKSFAMKYTLAALLSMTFISIWSCEVSETGTSADIESSILTLIAADDSSFIIDGMENVEDEEYALGKAAPGTAAEPHFVTDVRHDSTSVWRFGRRNMSQTRVVTMEEETDSSALALVSIHITGSFHVRQFERVWTSDSTWVCGDSIRFSVKPIDLTVDRRVAFRKRILANGEQRWRTVAKTVAYGSTGNELDLTALEWRVGDSLRVLNNFESRFYRADRPLILSILGGTRVSVRLMNDTAGEAEMVQGNWGYHSNQDALDLRQHGNFHYIETLDNGQKRYGRWVSAPDRPLHQFRGSIQVVDLRTLFDHDYPVYNAALLSFQYTLSRQPRD